MSLDTLPDAVLCFSTKLASRVGVEEAILHQALEDLAPLFNGRLPTRSGITPSPLNIPRSALESRLPFWQTADIQRLLGSLSNRGSITLLSAPLPQVEALQFQFGRATPMPRRVQPATQRAVRPPEQTPQNRALPIGPQWRPTASTIAELEAQGISKKESESHIQSFVQHYREKGELRFNWNQRFKHWVKQAQVYETRNATREQKTFEQEIREAAAMATDWRPDSDAINILVRAQVDQQFIEDAIPEFILYWRERGEVHKTWNHKFVTHVRNQWLRYQNAVRHSRTPEPMSENWQPDDSLFDILKMANIDRCFAEQLVPEFVLYWREAGMIHNSWNSKFLEHVKQKWSQRLSQHGASGQASSSGYGAAANAQAQLTDTSWAE